jgi:hypothetical protein
MSARFEVRRLDFQTARRLLGTGIDMCPKEALFKGYIQLEMDVSLFSPLSHKGFVMERIATAPRVRSRTNAV